jgi:HEAT repeat protein
MNYSSHDQELINKILINIGSPAVDSLTTLLLDNMTSQYVLPHIAEALKLIKDTRAIKPLVQAFVSDDKRYTKAKGKILDALIYISGQNFGNDYDKWKSLAAEKTL